MRCVLVLVIVCFLCLAVEGGPVGRTFNQQRDHLSGSDRSTFTQYFWTNEDYYISGGPTLVYLSSFPNPSDDLQNSAISEWGSSLGAVVVELEVRYSGRSTPTTNFTSETFQYQSPEQNIEDIISFRDTFVKMYPAYTNSSWILIGEYYNANYAIWCREKYPNIIVGSVGVAGPVQAQADFPEYFNYWATVAGIGCATAIHDANEETQLMLAKDPQQASQIKGMFGCANVDDSSQFFYVLGQVIQYGIANERSFVCDSLLNYSYNYNTLFEQYAFVISQLLQLSGVTDCNSWNIAEDTEPDNPYRPTFYLSCAYLGQFETAGTSSSSIVNSMVNVYWYLSVCELLFDVVLVPDTEGVNEMYGGLHPSGSNYAFVTSTSDPFRALVVNETNLESSDIIRVTTTESIFSFISNDNITQNIQDGRNQVLDLMTSWMRGDSASQTPLPSPSPSSGTNDDLGSLNWTLYLYMVVGILCLVVVVIILGVAVLEYTNQVLNRRG